MNSAWALVARPTSTSSSPVANGSSVPAWPVFTPPSARRTAATTLCELMPAGLSSSSTPSARSCAAARTERSSPDTRDSDTARLGERRGGLPAGVRLLALGGDLAAQEGDQFRRAERGGEPRGAGVPAAALRARDRGHVELGVGGAQRDFALPPALAGEDVAHEH